MMDMAITIDLEKINRNHEEVHFHVLSIDSRFLFFSQSPFGLQEINWRVFSSEFGSLPFYR